MEGEPAVIGPRLEVVEEAVGPLEPAVGDGGLTTEGEAIERVPGGDPGRSARVAPPAIEAVGALAGVECEAVVVKHVPDPTQTFERFGRLLER
jgi:hypothetical protein